MTRPPTEDLVLRYEPRSTAMDALRATLGLAGTVGPLIFLEPMVWISWILKFGVALFALFAVKTVDRAISRTYISASTIRQTGLWTRQLEWEAVSKVKLAYFGRRKGQSGGLMTLTVSDGRNRISVDGGLEQFDRLAGSVATLVRKKDIDIDTVTAHNFSVLGHGLEGN